MSSHFYEFNSDHEIKIELIWSDINGSRISFRVNYFMCDSEIFEIFECELCITCYYYICTYLLLLLLTDSSYTLELYTYDNIVDDWVSIVQKNLVK